MLISSCYLAPQVMFPYLGSAKCASKMLKRPQRHASRKICAEASQIQEGQKILPQKFNETPGQSQIKTVNDESKQLDKKYHTLEVQQSKPVGQLSTSQEAIRPDLTISVQRQEQSGLRRQATLGDPLLALDKSQDSIGAMKELARCESSQELATKQTVGSSRAQTFDGMTNGGRPSLNRPWSELLVDRSTNGQPSQSGQVQIVLAAIDAAQINQSCGPNQESNSDTARFEIGSKDQGLIQTSNLTLPKICDSNREQQAYTEPNNSNKNTVPRVLSRDQFEFLRTIGRGAYATVYLVRCRLTDQRYALKILSKEHILKYGKSEAVYRERDIALELSGLPNFVNFKSSFQDKSNLYFLFELAEMGSLANMLKRIERLPINLVRFYGAQLISALERMHSHQIAHRDLKPDNILLDRDFNIKITDFGDSKKLSVCTESEEYRGNGAYPDDRNSLFETQEGSRQTVAGTFVGTVLYISPEMLTDNKAVLASDLWALGCILYQMRTGSTPFQADSDFQVFSKITSGSKFKPKTKIEPELMDLIDKLLRLEPSQRLGAGKKGSLNDYRALKSHPFFKAFKWECLDQTLPPIPDDKRVLLTNLLQIKEKRRNEAADSKITTHTPRNDQALPDQTACNGN